MSVLLVENASQVTAACTEKISAIAESINQAIGTNFELSCGEVAPLAADSSAPPSSNGLLLTLSADGAHLLVVLPEDLPLPTWYTNPDKSQQSRLDNLAMELSLNCFPDDTPADGFACTTRKNLAESVIATMPTPDAVSMPILVAGLSTPILLVWPVQLSAADLGNESLAGAPSEEQFAGNPAPTAGHSTPATAAAGDHAAANEFEADPYLNADQNSASMAVLQRRIMRLNRVRNVPVPVIVKLAQKRISLETLMSLSPGSIVIFDKSCDDLLDLFVNNRLYCRGEAVKIGEKFGLKVNEVGSVEQRSSAIISL